MEDDKGFILIGAGLPRTGTMSTRTALKQLLKGDIYHMKTVMEEPVLPFWNKVLAKEASIADWKEAMADFRGGVDYPVSFYYKELMKAYPNAKVLLNIRDPVKWYKSVEGSILRVVQLFDSWPVSWFILLMGHDAPINFNRDFNALSPSCSSSGLGMMAAVDAGEQTAVQFYHDHVNEVKAYVPSDRLLVWEVKDGWAPLCQFLGVPVPEQPFPRVNDTAEIVEKMKKIKYVSWTIVVFVPLAMALGALYMDFSTPTHYLGIFGLYLVVIGLFRLLMKRSVKNHGE